MQRLTTVLFWAVVVMAWGCGGSGTTVTPDGLFPGDDAEVVGDEVTEDGHGAEVADTFDVFPDDGRGEDTDAADVLPDTPPIPCEGPADCPDGEGCLDTGFCGPCESAEDCEEEEGCSPDGVCGPCQTGEDCLEGDGCNGDGECGPCGLTEHCPEGQACIETVCRACEFSTQCLGDLCVDGACVPCTPGDDDVNCAEEYGKDNYVCLEDGTCGVVTCITDEECYPLHLVCIDEECSACDVDTQNCPPDVYGPEAQCIEGYCVLECFTEEDCFDEKPVCGTDGRCRECNANAECDDVVPEDDVTDGLLALCTPTGQCVAGNCGDIEETLILPGREQRSLHGPRLRVLRRAR